MSTQSRIVMTLAVTAVLMTIVVGVWACHPRPPIWIELPERDNGLSGTVEIKATVTDGLKLSSVEFFVDDESIGTDKSEPFSVQWDTTTVDNGEHKVHAVGTKPDGETVKSKTVTVVVDNEEDETTSESESEA